MKKHSLSEYNGQMKILWCAMLCASVFALVYAVFGAFSYSVSQLVVLGFSLFISVLLSRQTINIPGTQARISFNQLIVFWGIIWLGIPGGVLISFCAALAKINKKEKNLEPKIFQLFSNVSATLAAAIVFYLFLENTIGFTGAFVGANPVGAVQFIIAVCLMAMTHFVINSLFMSAHLSFQKNYSISEILRRIAGWNVAEHFALTVAAVLLHCVFAYFGIAFGLVLMPVGAAGYLAYCFHNRILEQKTKEITDASRIHLATVEALATAIDARDQVGIGHVRRAQIYAIGIGKTLGLSEEEIDALRTGALLHDIGKLAVPDHILNKPGRLTPAEMEKTKVHAPIGAAILEKVGFTCPVVPTVKYHHEMWDGTGYPEGLQGNEIPLTARILAVADAYDTLRGARPYRGALARDESRRILLSGAGKQFDPQIVDIFLRNLRRFEAEVEEQGFSYTCEREEKPENQFVSDIRGEHSYVEQIKRANREVFTLYELAREFSSSLNLQETLVLFTEKICDFVPFDTCAIYLLDETGESAKVAYTEGKNHQELKNKRIKVGEGATGYVLEKRQSVQNINPKLDFPASQYDFVHEYTAMASLPLISEEKLIGAISLYSCELLGYQEEHLRLLETVTRIAADAITKSIQLTETETRALTDPMTGLPNARSLQMHFEKEAARTSRSGNSFQVLMLDLDGFKAVNDTYGHKVGDLLLKGVAEAMSAQLREYDFLARYAGDEFVAIISEADKKAVNELCERIEKAVTGFKLPVGENEFACVGVSLGAASYPQNGDNFDQVVIAADKAMYAVKAARKRNRQKDLKRNSIVVQAIIETPANQQKAGQQQTASYQTSGSLVPEIYEEGFVVELDESHIVSSAIN
ncbi:MAG TPA: diguanylate cyclase [Pyrinomonadaceae bacterium]|jgi:diguanylate cyclase (GGDEF)-like protein/putative nucleotidyltransferase with HDIG domain